MRKLGSLIVALGLVASLGVLTGCDAEVSKVDGEAGAATQEKPKQEEKTEFAKGEAIKVDDTVMTVTDAKQFKPTNEFDTPESGKVYYMVTVSLVNNGEEPADYNAFNYKIQDANGVQTDGTIVTDLPTPMNSGSLAPGGKFAGNLVFEVPADMKGLKLIMEPNIFSKQQISIKLTD